MLTNCSYCKKEINKKPYHIKNYKNVFCNTGCRSSFRVIKRIKKECKTCGKELLRREKEIAKNKTKNCFCSKSCSATWNNQQENRTGKNHPNWKNGESSGRYIAIKNKKLECERCNYKENPGIIQVHHKDRDRKNNDLDNLEMLCPNCHCLDHLKNKDGIFSNLK